MNKVVVALVVGLVSAAPALAEDGGYKATMASMSPFEKLVYRGQQAANRGSMKTALTIWKKAIAIAPEPKKAADVQTRMAEALAEQKKYGDASGYLDQAMQTYGQLGGVSSDFARVYADVTAKARQLGAQVFGDAAAKTLNDNAAKVSMQQTDNGTAHVDIVAPTRFVADVKSDKVDQVAFEKAVSFDVVRDTAGNTVVSNIKGFKMHVLEKGMWVNLLNLVVKPADGTGVAPAEVTAGKAGITKVVESSLTPPVVAPIDALTKSAAELGRPLALTLPILMP